MMDHAVIVVKALRFGLGAGVHASCSLPDWNTPHGPALHNFQKGNPLCSLQFCWSVLLLLARALRPFSLVQNEHSHTSLLMTMRGREAEGQSCCVPQSTCGLVCCWVSPVCCLSRKYIRICRDEAGISTKTKFGHGEGNTFPCSGPNRSLWFGTHTDRWSLHCTRSLPGDRNLPFMTIDYYVCLLHLNLRICHGRALPAAPTRLAAAAKYLTSASMCPFPVATSRHTSSCSPVNIPYSCTRMISKRPEQEQALVLLAHKGRVAGYRSAARILLSVITRHPCPECAPSCSASTSCAIAHASVRRAWDKTGRKLGVQ
jgi:hypothetical protein